MTFEMKLSHLKQLEHDLEQDIQSLGLEDATISRKRFCLQMRYRECILDHPGEAHVENVDAMLWRHCFHIPIDYYRRRVKDSRSSEGRWAICEMNRIIDSGLAFMVTILHDLVSSGGGLKEFLDETFIALGLPPAASKGNDVVIPGLSAVVYRLLIFTGDLARYRSQFNKYFQDDSYQLAWRIYVSAQQMEPEHGHACNQIAVVCSLLQDALMTVLWYLRAVCCYLPFTAARSNLIAYLEKLIIKEADNASELAVWKPLLTFLYKALYKNETEYDDFVGWLRKKAFKLSPFEFASILMILAATLKVSDDPDGVYRRLLGKCLSIFIQTDSKALLHPTSEEDQFLLLITILAIWNLSDLSDIEDDLLDWIIGLQGITISSKTETILRQLSGFELFEPILELCSSYPDLGRGCFLAHVVTSGKIVSQLELDNGNIVRSTCTARLISPIRLASPITSLPIPESLPNLFVVTEESLSPIAEKPPSISEVSTDEDEIIVFRGFL